MTDHPLFEIGIYRTSPEQFEADRSRSVPMVRPSPFLSDEPNSERQAEAEARFYDEHPGDFRYNDQVGAIQVLGVTSDYIVVEYIFVTVKRLTYQMRTKK